MEITNKVYNLILERKKREKAKKKKLTQKQLDEQVKKWTTFYRRNWNIYAKRELGIPLYFFQEVILYLMGISEVFFEQCSRGLSKSFIAALAAVIQCMLYPNSEVVLTSQTIGTAKKLVEKKIENELCKKMSKKLRYLYENKQIIFKYDKNEIKVTFTFNNSWILILPEADSSLGERACMLLFEEARIMKQYSVDSIFMPMSRPRQAEYLLLPEYQDSSGKPLPELVEPCKKIYMTSTKYKYMWFWKRWVKVVEGTFNSKYTRVKYNFCCGDIFTAIAHGIKTEKDLQEYQETMSELELRMEIYNEPQGEVEGAFYSIQQFKENSVIENAFVPPTYEEYVVKYEKGKIPYFREKKVDEVRVIYVDFAFADTVKKNQENDNTVIGCMSGYKNKDATKILRNCEYMETYSGGKKDESIKRIRELFYLYQADYLIYDNLNGGEDRFIELSKPFYHEELGINMNGFGIYTNLNITKFFCEENKLLNLAGRVVDSNAIPVAIPVVGNNERNNNFHISLKSALNNNTFRLLIDEIEFKQKMEENSEYALLNSEERARIRLGYVQIGLMVDEAIKLEQEVKGGYIKLTEPPHTGTKDRIMATEYANYFFHLKELELAKESQEEEYDIDDYSFLTGDYTGY